MRREEEKLGGEGAFYSTEDDSQFTGSEDLVRTVLIYLCLAL